MAKADQLREQATEAKARINKIGAPQPHLRGESGKLHSVTVKTSVHHQASSGATNYWEDQAFDIALAQIVCKRFASLADEALALMFKRADEALIAEEASLRARLAEIERLKASA